MGFLLFESTCVVFTCLCFLPESVSFVCVCVCVCVFIYLFLVV